ncbi:hypothetical protein AAG570_000615 [Ranatra chinensis]|uniref:Protein Wnt n=1 Tax=Ranatra chinensis TaxID=642074 RepID=A0ABD0YXJ8_9HEMI
MAKERCKEQFKWERWNCPDSAFSRKTTVPVTREMAFVSAMTSAGIVHSLTRSCAQGDLSGCGCSRGPAVTRESGHRQQEEEAASTRVEWSWSGCSDNVHLGERVADLFLGAMEHGSDDMNAQTNIHNYKLGKTMVRESMRKECKCHGLSGSCSVQSCWRRVGNLRQVAESLKRRYDRATRVQWNAARPTAPNVPETNLVFLADSPDYCKADLASGWEGTAGRVCSRSKGGSLSERRSCRELCRSCGHQVRRRTVHKTKLCNCTFQWCCKVTCSKCTNTVQEFYCDATPFPYLKNN